MTILKIMLIVLLTLCLVSPALSDTMPPIKVGAIFAKSGEAAEDNLELFEAVRFAVEQFNSSGGLHGRTIQLLEYDNHSTPIQSKLAAKHAVKDGVVAVIGASWSSHSLAIAPYLQKMKIPMISPDSTHPDVTKVGDYIFRACFNDTFQGEALANFARNKLKASSAVIIQNINSDYSLGLSSSFKRFFDDHGGRIAATLNYKSNQTDFTSQLNHVRQLAPDILFVPGHSESGFVVRQAQNMGIRSIMLGGDGWPYKQFYANGGQDLHEGYYSAHWYKTLENPESVAFINQYNAVYDVTEFTATAYDAATLLFAAMRRAGSGESQAIRDALAKTRDFSGVTGKISFDANGDPQKQVVMMKITEGRPSLFSLVLPEENMHQRMP